MLYDELIALLDSVDTDRMYPIVIPSVLRPGYATYKNIVCTLPKKLKKRVFFVIREDQREQYEEAQPDSNFLVLPEKLLVPGFGLDNTRAWYQKKMLKMGYDKIIEFDDDLIGVTMVYQNPETHTTRRLGKKDQAKYQSQILALACIVSDWWFATYKDACLGGFCKITPQTCSWEYANTLGVSHRMGVAQTFMVTNLKRLKRLGALHTGDFDVHAEDIAFNVNILSHGGNVFKLPPFVVNMVPAENNPRTEIKMQKDLGDEKALCGMAYRKLVKIGDYLRVTKTFDDGSPRYFTIDWNKYDEQHGTEPVIRTWKRFLKWYRNQVVE